MPYVSVNMDIDVDLDDIDSDDLIGEVIERITTRHNKLTEKEKSKLKKALSMRYDDEPDGKSLRDIQIDELFLEAKKRFTQYELENRLK